MNIHRETISRTVKRKELYNHVQFVRMSPLSLYIVPSGPPREVMVQAISSTSIQVSWQPPQEEDKNGVIIGYQLTLRSSSDSRILSFTQVHNLTALIPG